MLLVASRLAAALTGGTAACLLAGYDPPSGKEVLTRAMRSGVVVVPNPIVGAP